MATFASRQIFVSDTLSYIKHSSFILQNKAYHRSTIMSHQIPDKVLHRASKDVYRTRFLMQSAATKKSKTSDLIKQMGGPAVLDFVAIALSERINKNPAMKDIYGCVTLKALVPLVTDLLLFAFADDRGADSSRSILAKHCELGLMVEAEYFDTLFQECIKCMCDCIEDEAVIMEAGKRFGELHGLLLEETHAQIIRMHADKRHQAASPLSSPMSSPVNSKKKFKRISLFSSFGTNGKQKEGNANAA